ncbi:retrovirus-related pol polyprotein from transposon TNT 1-94 [Tanacetum coccineum]
MDLLLKNINIVFKQSKFTTSRDGYVIEGELKEYEDSSEKSSIQVFYKEMLNQSSSCFQESFDQQQLITQKKIKLAFENDDLSLRVELIPSEIKILSYYIMEENYIGRDLLQGYSSKNYVRKFFRALHPKWRANVTAIEESKDLTSLSLDELIENLKVHKMIIKKDSEIVKEKVERKSLALKAKKESSDEECSTSGSEDEEYAMATFKRSRDDKNGKSDRKCFRCGDPNHLIGECPKPPKDKNQRAFVGGSWSDSGEEYDEKVNNETCLVAQASSEICLGVDLEPDEWIKDSGCSKHMTGNRKLFLSYKAYNKSNVIFGSNLRDRQRVTFSEHDSEITKDEPKNVNEALTDDSWIVAMQEELNQFIANDVWELVPQPKNMTIIGTKWVFRNKLDENGIVSRNKARLVAQGYNQQEGIDYDETYAPKLLTESNRY